MTTTAPLPPPLASFTSPGGRAFTVEPGQHAARYDGDPCRFDAWLILFNGALAGRLYRSLSYGTTADGAPRWHASTRQLYWLHASDAPTGIGFDVAAFDSAEQACAAWARSADQILDWSEGRAVVGSYGVVKRAGGER